jgi:uncharacterized membrane protein
MHWSRWYSVRSYIKSSLWIAPFIALILYIIAIRLLDWLQSRIESDFLWPWGSASAQTILGTIVTLALSFIVFTFGSLLVAIQVASGQLTPRIIATALLRDNVIRATVGLFIFTLLFSLGVLGRLESRAPYLEVGIAGILGFCAIIAFLYLIDHSARLLRPVSIMRRIGDQGFRVIEDVYPDLFEGNDPQAAAERTLGTPDHAIVHSGKSGMILAVNLPALLKEAVKSGVIIELVPRVGNFVASGDTLFYIYGDDGTLDDDRLVKNVAFGSERTIEQDSTFAFRIIVDIGIKALSKAINDPTTAMLSIDQLQRLLQQVGTRLLHGDEIHDSSGQLRLIFRTPDWEDFVQLAVSEIRYYGADHLQIARRLRSMIEGLLRTLPPERHNALTAELAMLDAAIAEVYSLPGDLMLASIPDPQGLGAAS